MTILKEEKQINRPLLYLTGGLLLGETMALWITGRQGCFWLITGSAFLSCACISVCRAFGKKGGERWSVFYWFFAAAWCGALLGLWRMGWEKERIADDGRLLSSCAGISSVDEDEKTEIRIQGQVEEIQTTDYGYRLILGTCFAAEDEEKYG